MFLEHPGLGTSPCLATHEATPPDFIIQAQALAALDKNLIWLCSFYLIDSLTTPVANLTPGTITATRYSTPTQFWPPLKKPRAPRRKRPFSASSSSIPTTAMQDDASASSDNSHDIVEPDVTLHNNLDDLWSRMEGQDTHTPATLEAELGGAAVEAEDVLPPPPLHDSRATSSRPTDTEEPPLAMDAALAPDAPQPPTPASTPTRGPDAGVRQTSTARVEVGTGTIAYYSNKGAFQATCRVHKQCALTRVGSRARVQPALPAKGRPLGLMAAWLLAGGGHPTKEAHMACLRGLNYDMRKAAREELLRHAAGVEVAGYERPSSSVHDEPELLDGLL